MAGPIEMDTPTISTSWHPGNVLPLGPLSDAVRDAIKVALTPEQAVALTMRGEARARFDNGRWVANPLDAMIDIASVIDNRANDPRWRGLGPKGVCLQHRQFSCWDTLGGADNHWALMRDAQRLIAGTIGVPQGLTDCVAVATGMLDNGVANSLGDGVCHYYASWLTPPPAWAFQDPPNQHLLRTPVVSRFGHLFFAGVR